MTTSSLRLNASMGAIALRYGTKQFVFVTLLALCAVASAGTAWWSAGRAYENFETLRLADEVLARHLTLSARANDLFKHYAAQLLVADHDGDARDGPLRAAIGQEIDAIRQTITREIHLQGEDEVEELNRLALIERELTLAEGEFARIRRLREAQNERVALTALIGLLDERIEGRLKALIEEAVAEERREAAQVAEAAQSLQASTQALTRSLFAATVLVAVLALIVLTRGLNRPLSALLKGTEAITRGQLSHRIALRSPDEFGQLAAQFDTMAAELHASRDRLERARLTLQSEVQERTNELAKTNASLAEQDALRRRFLADISHELRTPLTVLRGEAEVVLRDKSTNLGAPARAVLEGVVEQVAQMSRLVDDLLFVARREAGEARLALRPVALTALVLAAVKDARALSVRRSMTILFDPPADPITVMADEGRLRQLLLILLDNAVRYSPPGGTVRVHAVCAAGGATVRVADDGVGIPADELAHVFDRFVRGSNVAAAGSGLGLPVAKAIADAHGGRIHLESAEGHGTTASLTLPAGPSTGSIDGGARDQRAGA